MARILFKAFVAKGRDFVFEDAETAENVFALCALR